MTATEYCLFCQQPVPATPDNRVGDDFSASGARPTPHAHPECGPQTQPNTALRRN
ncbi:hypothetical protein [Streptomyces sp. NPDC020965]|uniref:hypothetical protein n=1 Tax=Streptomyces sp. NPDC020965 TaxID=3365105 RepID=UPI0037ABE1C1